MKRKLTEKQSAVLWFICTRIYHCGMPPTRAEIADEFGFRSANAAQEVLKVLERKGWIELTPGKARAIRLPSEDAA